MLTKEFISKGYSALMVGLITLTMLSCNKRDDDVIIDTIDPTITITNPTPAQFNTGFEAGSTITITGTVTDNELVESIRIRVATATGVAILDEQMNNVNQQSVTLNQSVLIPQATPEGNYTLTIDATDRAGNTGTFTETFAIRPAAGGSQVTFNVTIPESTPEGSTVYIVGDFNDWDPGDDDYILNPVEGQDYLYTITLDWQEVTEYKFTLGSLESVEKDEDCEEIENRVFTPTAETHEIDVIVENWAGLGECAEVEGDQVTIYVTTPGTTPAEASVYISGPFNDWNPADEDYLLTPVEGEENMYFVILNWQQPTEYKYTLGSPANIEKDANCEDVENRIFTPTGEAQEINDIVENWAGFGNCPEDQGAQVTFIVITPETTPEGATVYITGTFNEWDPEDEDYLLTPVEGEENTYSITLIWNEATEYKFTLGALENVEKDENCEDIDNRIFTPGLEEQEIEDTVENWAGFGDCPED